MSKEFWKSKTFYFGLAWAIISVVTAVLNHYGYQDWVPSADLVSIVALLNAVLIILLRQLTGQGLKWRK